MEDPQNTNTNPTEDTQLSANNPAQENINNEPHEAAETIPTLVSQPAEVPPRMSVEPIQKPTNNAGLIVLQWLTYAFWGWALVGIAWIVIAVLNSSSDDGSMATLPYAIAAVLVLLPIAVICDTFYLRKEPLRKQGIATAVMVIHAVLFALITIGWTIAALFTIINAAINGADESVLRIVGSFIIIAVLYALTFLRTLHPAFLGKLVRLYSLLMILVVILFVILAFVFPIARAHFLKSDRTLESVLPEIPTAVSGYVTEHHALPTALNDTNVDQETRKAIDQGLIQYKPEGIATTTITPGSTYNQSTQYRYQLCVDYKAKDTSSSSYATDYSSSYATYLSTSGHDAGHVCYRLSVETY